LVECSGGSELGNEWHDAGRLDRKNNSFLDFIATADELLARKVSKREKMAAYGVSAGGLLIGNCFRPSEFLVCTITEFLFLSCVWVLGSVINKRPDLFRAVVAQVPFVDPLTSMLDASLPLTSQEYDEVRRQVAPDHSKQINHINELFRMLTILTSGVIRPWTQLIIK
jgi:oligopeptidase B